MRCDTQRTGPRLWRQSTYLVKPAKEYKQISLILRNKRKEKSRGKDRNRVTGINNGRKKKVS